MLPLYVMIVQFLQNFTKMREFSQIRGKKNYGKHLSFTRYDYVSNWEHWRFPGQTVETNSKLFISIQSNQLVQVHDTFPSTR